MINALRRGGRLLSQTIQEGKSKVMYREKGGKLYPSIETLLSFVKSFSLFLSRAKERTSKKSRIITMRLHVTVWIYIYTVVFARESGERDRKANEFEESIPTGFIPTDRFLEFCDSSFFEDDPSECLACPSHLDPSPPPFPFGSSRDFRPQRIGVDFTRYRTRLDACDVPLNRGGRRLRKS